MCAYVHVTVHVNVCFYVHVKYTCNVLAMCYDQVTEVTPKKKKKKVHQAEEEATESSSAVEVQLAAYWL